MNIKVHSSELNRMMKTILQCIDPKDPVRGSIEIIYDNNLLSIRACNGMFSAVMSTPMLGGTGERFCVDGTMFARVISLCSGDADIVTDGNFCTIKGVGRTRLPIIAVNVPAFEPVNGKTISVKGGDFSSCYAHVAYAVSTENSRPVLTGVLTEIDSDCMRMVALDGFQMSVEETECSGDGVKAVIPGAFMKLIVSGIFNDDTVKLTFGNSVMQATADGMILRTGLLSGEFVDYERILPKEFKSIARVKVDDLRNVLKAGNVVNNAQKLVKMSVTDSQITVRNNSEQADFEADVECAKNGDDLKIAFNEKYLMNTMNVIDDDTAEMCFNGPTSPVIVRNMDGAGTRLVLPVRVMG